MGYFLGAGVQARVSAIKEGAGERGGLSEAECVSRRARGPGLKPAHLGRLIRRAKALRSHRKTGDAGTEVPAYLRGNGESKGEKQIPFGDDKQERQEEKETIRRFWLRQNDGILGMKAL
jgi:hypothetical protein